MKQIMVTERLGDAVRMMAYCHCVLIHTDEQTYVYFIAVRWMLVDFQ